MMGQKFWLGLKWTTNGWVFVHAPGNELPVPKTINYWDGGKVPDGSNGMTCAYFDPNGKSGNW